MEATWWTNPTQLDPDQKKVVALPKLGNYLIIGPPGSGKTNLLVLRATFLHNAGVHDTVVITFGRVLREFLVTGTTNYPFSHSKIQTYVRWALSVLQEHGVNIEEQGSFNALRVRILHEMQTLISSGKIEARYDCILIDEAQDYSPGEIQVMQFLTKHMFAVGDDRQRIYKEEGAISMLTSFCELSTLRFHYRNGINICRVADGIYDQIDQPTGLEASCQYDERAFKSSVTPYPGLSISDQVKVAVGEIATQLRAYPEGIIGVLCPRHEELDEVCSLLESSMVAHEVQVQRHADGYGAFEPEKRVVVTTLHGAKGLEFRALHLLGMDKISKFRSQRRSAYTAVTRAKTSLAIYHDGDLPGYLERGIAATEPERDPPDLEDLFN